MVDPETRAPKHTRHGTQSPSTLPHMSYLQLSNSLIRSGQKILIHAKRVLRRVWQLQPQQLVARVLCRCHWRWGRCWQNGE